jgi:UDP-glucose 4-epimerase
MPSDFEPSARRGATGLPSPPGRLLITGGAGFIGSHLTEAWLERGGEVTVLDDFSAGRRVFLAAVETSNRLRIVSGDVRDRGCLAGLIQDCSLVAHLASVVGVERVLAEPVRTMQVAAQGGRLVAALCAAWDRPLLSVSSSEVYGPWALPPLRETLPAVDLRPWGPRGIYARAKRVAERAALGPGGPRQAVVVRLFNVSGPRQDPATGMVLPRWVAAARRGEPLQLFGSGRQTRSFCHVRDAVAGLLGLLDALVRPPGLPRQVFNLGAPFEHELSYVAQRVLALTGSRSPVVPLAVDEVAGRRGLDTLRRAPALERIQAAIGWRAEIGLDRLILDLAASAEPQDLAGQRRSR